VTINKVEVISKRHIFSFLLKESKVSLKEIKNIEFQKSSSEGKGSTRVDYYKIFILNEKNQKMTIAETIPGIELARSLNYYIKSKYLK
jgi:hypothetical protein